MFLPAVSSHTRQRLFLNVNMIDGVEELGPERTKVVIGGRTIEVEGSYTRIVAQIKSVMGVEE